MEGRLPHERLIVYGKALDLAVGVRRIEKDVPRGYRNIADHLARSAQAVVLLIAEGANRASSGDKRARYREARGECGEISAALDLLDRLDLVPTPELAALRPLVREVSAMLLGLERRYS